MNMNAKIKNILEVQGIDPRTSRMLSERSTIWATPPTWHLMNEIMLLNVLFPNVTLNKI